MSGASCDLLTECPRTFPALAFCNDQSSMRFWGIVPWSPLNGEGDWTLFINQNFHLVLVLLQQNWSVCFFFFPPYFIHYSNSLFTLPLSWCCKQLALPWQHDVNYLFIYLKTLVSIGNYICLFPLLGICPKEAWHFCLPYLTNPLLCDNPLSVKIWTALLALHPAVHFLEMIEQFKE